MDKGYIHFLKAQIGDAFILLCRKGDSHGIIVVDGGYGINSRLNKFLSEIEKVESVDIMVLTHPDDDHLLGIKEYVKKHLSDEPFPVKEIWANCAPNVEINLDPNLSARKAKQLSDILTDLHNEEKTIWKNDITSGLNLSLPFADIQVLGPSNKTLHEFIERYRGKIGYEVGDKGIDASARSFDTDLNTDMRELATRAKPKCNLSSFSEASNASSISFILSCDDFSILMLGDAFPDDVIDGMKALGYSKENPLKVDYVKMPHHGSAPNISNELLDMIDCENFIVSTNGEKYRHPDREALANVLCHDNRKTDVSVCFHFNYPLQKIEAAGKHIFNEELDKYLNYTIHEPSPADVSGLILTKP